MVRRVDRRSTGAGRCVCAGLMLRPSNRPEKGPYLARFHCLHMGQTLLARKRGERDWSCALLSREV